MTRTPTKAQMRAAYDVELRALQKIIEDQNATLSDLKAKAAKLLNQKTDAVQVAVAAENLADERRLKIEELREQNSELKADIETSGHIVGSLHSEKKAMMDMASVMMRALGEGLTRD